MHKARGRDPTVICLKVRCGFMFHFTNIFKSKTDPEKDNHFL